MIWWLFHTADICSGPYKPGNWLWLFGDVIHLPTGRHSLKMCSAYPGYYPFINRKKVIPVHGMIREWIIVSGIIFLFVAFSVYNLRHLPVVIFAYEVGVYIPDKMVIPKTNRQTLMKLPLSMKKTFAERIFLENYPEDDSTWKFVDQRLYLLAKDIFHPSMILYLPHRTMKI